MGSSEFDDDFAKVLVENTAQTVFKRLKLLANARDRYKYRWVWELLQNASDCSTEGGVRVSIMLADGVMTFAHDGKPFSNKNVGHLIYHGSTKQEDDDAAGRFGTGFMTTHLVSKNVRVQGMLVDGRWFDFELCREGDSADALRDNMDASRASFESSLRNKIDEAPEYATRYTYPVDGDIVPDVRKAIDDLKRHGPFVLAFNERLREVQIGIDGECHTFAKGVPLPLTDDFSLYPIGRPEALPNEPDVFVVSSPMTASVQVGLLLRREADRYDVVLTDDTPRLFVLFPLLGTESFSFPAVVNSDQFEPTEDRDGVFLWMSNGDTIHRNENLLERAIKLFHRLSKLPALQGWGRPDQLARVCPIQQFGWLQAETYRGILQQQLLDPLRDSPLVINLLGQYVAPSQAKLPIASDGVTSEELWECASFLACLHVSLPQKNDVVNWADTIAKWAAIRGVEPASLHEALTIETLASMVAEWGSVQKLTEHLVADRDPYAWLDAIFRLVQCAGIEHLFDDLAILPNQKGTFCNRNAPLYFDQGIDDGLKDIAEQLGLPGRKELLASQIESHKLSELLLPKTGTGFLTECVAELKRQAKTGVVDKSTFSEVNRKLLGWIVTHQLWDELADFPAITRDETSATDNLCRLVQDAGDDDELPLGPAYAWPEKARRFAELFPSRRVLSELYTPVVTTAMWEAIATRGFVRLSPLFERTGTIRCFLPDESVPLDDEENSIESADEVEFSQIAFLSLRDQGLIDRVRKGKERALLFLEFVLTFVLEQDKQAFDEQDVACDDDKTHTYFRAGWLIPLATRSWIPTGKQSSKPTAESLGNLLRHRLDVLGHFSTQTGRKLLSAIRVGFADLSLHTLAETDEARVSLINAISSIARAAAGDAERVQSVAEEIARSPELLDRIEEHRKVRERVEKNQSIGRIVEELLRDNLAAEGLTVRRTGIGSDYEVENDQIENKEEQVIEVAGVRSFLIEIKSARADKVGMTVTQAKMAVAQHDHFLLCVVTIDSEQPTKEDVRTNARFVTDIGVRLQSAVAQFEKFEKSEEAVREPTDDANIEIDITDSSTRFKVSVALAKQTGLSFDDALLFIRQKAAPIP